MGKFRRIFVNVWKRIRSSFGCVGIGVHNDPDHHHHHPIDRSDQWASVLAYVNGQPGEETPRVTFALRHEWTSIEDLSHLECMQATEDPEFTRDEMIEIAVELDYYKRTEMDVHEESRIYTRFELLPEQQQTEYLCAGLAETCAASRSEEAYVNVQPGEETPRVTFALRHEWTSIEDLSHLECMQATEDPEFTDDEWIEIAVELDYYKRTEMDVHEESRIYTRFEVLPEQQHTEYLCAGLAET